MSALVYRVRDSLAAHPGEDANTIADRLAVPAEAIYQVLVAFESRGIASLRGTVAGFVWSLTGRQILQRDIEEITQ